MEINDFKESSQYKKGNKVFACFIEYKSLWLNTPRGYNLQVGIHGSCMLKIIAKRTELFNYTKAVRQGRPLSPLPFNNFTNDMVKCLNKMNPQP